MSNFKRERSLKKVRYAKQIELLDLINAGVQTNASLIAFAGANTAATKMKRITDKNDAILAEQSSLFGGRGTRFYRMRNKDLDYINAKENNAISHAVYLLRDAGYLVDIVKPYFLKDYEVNYRTVAVVQDLASELVFSYFNSQKGELDYARKFYNFDEDVGRVIVFDDVISYRRFLRNAKKDSAVDKISGQLHVVLDSSQSSVKAAKFNMRAFMISKNNHDELSAESLKAFLSKYILEDKELVSSIVKDYKKAEINAAKFEKNMEK